MAIAMFFATFVMTNFHLYLIKWDLIQLRWQCFQISVYWPRKSYRATLKGPLIKMFRKDAPHGWIILIYKKFRENTRSLFKFVLAFLLLSRYVKGVIFFNVINPEKLPLNVPEAGIERSTTKKENAVKAPETLSYPVTESNHHRTPTENSSDTDTTRSLPYPIAEEDKNQKKNGIERSRGYLHFTHWTYSNYRSYSQDTASSSIIEGLVNCSSSERCTTLSGIGKS